MFVSVSLHFANSPSRPYPLWSLFVWARCNRHKVLSNSPLRFPLFSPQADVQVTRPLAVSALHQVYMPLEGSSPALAQHLQPVLILEPHTGLLHSQLVSCEFCKYIVQIQTRFWTCKWQLKNTYIYVWLCCEPTFWDYRWHMELDGYSVFLSAKKNSFQTINSMRFMLLQCSFKTRHACMRPR